MVDLLQTVFLNPLSISNKISNKIPLKYISRGLTGNNLRLVQVMTWCRKGDKPLFEPMVGKISDGIRYH